MTSKEKTHVNFKVNPRAQVDIPTDGSTYTSFQQITFRPTADTEVILTNTSGSAQTYQYSYAFYLRAAAVGGAAVVVASKTTPAGQWDTWNAPANGSFTIEALPIEKVWNAGALWTGNYDVGVTSAIEPKDADWALEAHHKHTFGVTLF